MNQYVTFIVGAGGFGGKKNSPVVKVGVVCNMDLTHMLQVLVVVLSEGPAMQT